MNNLWKKLSWLYHNSVYYYVVFVFEPQQIYMTYCYDWTTASYIIMFYWFLNHELFIRYIVITLPQQLISLYFNHVYTMDNL